jgi:hypothetical protein
VGGVTSLKRISLAGSDVGVTDGGLAGLVLEYAKHLGRIGTTDTVTLPIAHDGRVAEASLLIGPASQIVLWDNDDLLLDLIELPDVDEVAADLARRLGAINNEIGHPILEDDAGSEDSSASFTDFDVYS